MIEHSASNPNSVKGTIYVHGKGKGTHTLTGDEKKNNREPELDWGVLLKTRDVAEYVYACRQSASRYELSRLIQMQDDRRAYEKEKKGMKCNGAFE